MNYLKIYADFIISRRERETAIVGYSEKHHIVPRALGGGDEKSNILRLTPIDHIHAHILLARIYGGRMWAAVHLMTKTSIGRTRSVKRIPSKHEIRAVAFARKMNAIHCVGVHTSQYGKTHSADVRLKMSNSHMSRTSPTWKQKPENKIMFSGSNHWTCKPENADALVRALPIFIANLKLASIANTGSNNVMHRPEVARKVSSAMRAQYSLGVGVGSAEAIHKRKLAHQTEEYRAKAREAFKSKKHVMGGTLGKNPNARKVQCVETGVIFNSVKEASFFCGGDVTRAARTGGKAGSFHWIRLGTHSADGRNMKHAN